MVIVLSNRNCLVYHWLYCGSYINMSHRVSKKKIKKFLTLRFRKEPMLMYDDTLDVAISVIQDFVNCDPLDVGKLQANTYDTIYNIEKEINDNI